MTHDTCDRCGVTANELERIKEMAKKLFARPECVFDTCPMPDQCKDHCQSPAPSRTVNKIQTPTLENLATTEVGATLKEVRVSAPVTARDSADRLLVVNNNSGDAKNKAQTATTSSVNEQKGQLTDGTIVMLAPGAKTIKTCKHCQQRYAGNLCYDCAEKGLYNNNLGVNNAVNEYDHTTTIIPVAINDDKVAHDAELRILEANRGEIEQTAAAEIVRHYPINEMVNAQTQFALEQTAVTNVVPDLRPRVAITEDQKVTLKRTDDKQALPTHNQNPIIQELVMHDFSARLQLGIKRYGTGLQANNNRDMMTDLYDELMDACVYIRGVLFERDGK